MNNRAFIFPGQGSQFVGMGKDLYDSNERARKIFESANRILDFDLAKVCFEGPEDKLKQTHITQPAIFVHSIAVYEILKNENFLPGAVAGHSLGEYSALVAADALSFEDGLRLVKIRGELMLQAGKIQPGTMAAIIGMSVEQVNNICNSVKNIGIVCAANFNSPGQVAISGEIPAVQAAVKEAKELGAKMAVELEVSGAFHSPLMKSAQEGLQKALAQTEINYAAIPVYTNARATPTTDKNEIRDMLYKQLTSPVRWIEIIQNMVSYGVQDFYEIGPGKVLTGLNKRIDRNVPCAAVGDVSSIEMITKKK